jgi:proteasome lid subunit RPN8/RPN11
VEWRIAAAVIAEIEQHTRDARPRECCGVLLGAAGHVTAARRVRNLADDPNRFELDPQGHVAAIRETRGTAVAVVGFYHSHPHSPPIPSARDLAESNDPDALYLIAGVAGPERASDLEIRAYHLRGEPGSPGLGGAAGYEEVSLLVIAADDER